MDMWQDCMQMRATEVQARNRPAHRWDRASKCGEWKRQPRLCRSDASRIAQARWLVRERVGEQTPHPARARLTQASLFGAAGPLPLPLPRPPPPPPSPPPPRPRPFASRCGRASFGAAPFVAAAGLGAAGFVSASFTSALGARELPLPFPPSRGVTAAASGAVLLAAAAGLGALPFELALPPLPPSRGFGPPGARPSGGSADA
mmetsp:Transcript_27023/g.68721  ORF Transcript_27023/g.68721 Transcript_27023/m.68721 type:complete len:203 (+) Transcript_27023:403-1011(+)